MGYPILFFFIHILVSGVLDKSRFHFQAVLMERP
jgi:hypothetical protein